LTLRLEVRANRAQSGRVTTLAGRFGVLRLRAQLRVERLTLCRVLRAHRLEVGPFGVAERYSAEQCFVELLSALWTRVPVGTRAWRGCWDGSRLLRGDDRDRAQEK
jgi:hypothetical protein